MLREWRSQCLPIGVCCAEGLGEEGERRLDVVVVYWGLGEESRAGDRRPGARDQGPGSGGQETRARARDEGPEARDRGPGPGAKRRGPEAGD